MPSVELERYGQRMANDPAPAAKAPWLPPRWVITLAWKAHRGLLGVSGGRLGLSEPKGDAYGLAQLATTGRRSGSQRSVVIGYFVDGQNIVTMAMNGWGPAEPAWWLNLQAEPNAVLTTRGGVIEVTGRAATGEERARLWKRWSEIDKGLDQLAARRPNETAVVVLSPR